MSVVKVTKSNGALNISWQDSPHSRYTSYSSVSHDYIVIIRDTSLELQWMVQPRSTSLKVVGIPVAAFNNDTFQVTVNWCEAVASGDGYRVVQTASGQAAAATGYEEDDEELRATFDRQLSLHSFSSLRSTASQNVAMPAPEAITLTGWTTSVSLSAGVGIKVNSDKMLTAIERGSRLPATDKCHVTTSQDNQTLAGIVVYSGDDPQASLNSYVGQTTLESLPCRMQGIVDLELSLSVDVDGEVTVSARELTTGKEWTPTAVGQLALPARPSASNKPTVQARSTSTYSHGSVNWKLAPCHCPATLDRWLISITKVANNNNVPCSRVSVCFFIVPRLNRSFEFPLQLGPGCIYKVAVRPLVTSLGSGSAAYNNSTCHQMLQDGVAEFRAELTHEDLQNLFQAAIRQCGYSSTPCGWMYRNRWKEYFDDIFYCRRGIMEVYDKDPSGDQASPINKQIKGLFFMAGTPASYSYFGEIRITVPAETLLRLAPNVYFVDYYCMNGKSHYVTLVMTRTGSETDRLCREKLLPMNLNDQHQSPFLFRQYGRLYMSSAPYFHVELLFTENIDLNALLHEPGVTKTTVQSLGRSKQQGIPKNAACTKCNLKNNVTSRFSSF